MPGWIHRAAEPYFFTKRALEAPRDLAHAQQSQKPTTLPQIARDKPLQAFRERWRHHAGSAKRRAFLKDDLRRRHAAKKKP